MESRLAKLLSSYRRCSQALITVDVGQSVTDERNCVCALASDPSATWNDFTNVMAVLHLQEDRRSG